MLQGSSGAGLQARGKRAGGGGGGGRGVRDRRGGGVMWVCSASKVLSSEIESEDFLPLTPTLIGLVLKPDPKLRVK